MYSFTFKVPGSFSSILESASSSYRVHPAAFRLSQQQELRKSPKAIAQLNVRAGARTYRHVHPLTGTSAHQYAYVYVWECARRKEEEKTSSKVLYSGGRRRGGGVHAIRKKTFLFSKWLWFSRNRNLIHYYVVYVLVACTWLACLPACLPTVLFVTHNSFFGG